MIHERRGARGLNVNVCNPRNGFFAHLEWILELLAFQDLSGQPLRIKLSSPQYLSANRGNDFLEYFFAAKNVDEIDSPVSWLTIEEIDELGFARSYDSELNFSRAHRLFFDRYKLQPEFAAEISATRNRLIGDGGSLGVHYRGTDKYTEAKRLSYDTVLSAVDHELAKRSDHTRIFVATDEAKFLHDCIARYGSRVASLPDYRRSDDGRPVHLSISDGYQLGRDAMLNCLMLSRCDTVIKTSSILSAWAKVFNPDLEIYTLSRRRPERSYFPERSIPDFRMND